MSRNTPHTSSIIAVPKLPIIFLNEFFYFPLPGNPLCQARCLPNWWLVVNTGSLLSDCQTSGSSSSSCAAAPQPGPCSLIHRTTISVPTLERTGRTPAARWQKHPCVPPPCQIGSRSRPAPTWRSMGFMLTMASMNPGCCIMFSIVSRTAGFCNICKVARKRGHLGSLPCGACS